MPRKLFIGFTLLSVLVFAQPTAAQDGKQIRKIGFLSVFSEKHSGSVRWVRAFRQGLRDRGWVVGKNISIEYRWVKGRRECRVSGRRVCLPKLVDELLAKKVELMVVHGGLPAQVVQRKSKIIPVVMAGVSDAVGRGIVKSLAQPGGNVTGVTSRNPALAAKRLELLKEIIPGLSRVAVLWTPRSSASRYAWKQIQAPAQKLGLTLHSTELRGTADLGKALDDAVKAGVGAFISTSGMGAFKIKDIIGLTTKSRLPSIFPSAAHVKAGGLISYNKNNEHLYYLAAAYVDQILKGAKPRDLPIQQPTRFDLVVNMKTAKALGITFPPSILLRATKVIE